MPFMRIRTDLSYFFIFFLVLNQSAQAQYPACGADILRQEMQFQYPGLIVGEQQFNEKIFRVFSGMEPSPDRQPVPVVVPVVFHIMHNNGPENVADSIIQTAVDQLNLRFQNSAPYFDSTGHVINIQFCLASIDPFGNPTTGITRTVTPLTVLSGGAADDSAMKNLMRWPPELYLNIWVVNTIFGNTAGYATFPYNAGQAWDGIVNEYLYLTNSYLLTHEAGHYFGVYHTFQGGCYNYNCLLNGDNVCDTPPDNSYIGSPCMGNSCSTEMQDTSGFNPFTSDVDELPNYMDYSWCNLSFTQGQVDRMEAVVQLQRASLQLSNGCGNNPGQPAPVAAFTYTVSPCNNGQVTFNDATSLNTLSSEWDFNGDGLYEVSGHNFTFTFPASGTYNVTLRTYGAGGSDMTSQTVTVYKGTTFNYPIVNYPQMITDTIRACQGATLVFEGDPTGSAYLWSTGETTSTISLVADSSMAISLTMTDSSGFVWSTQCTPVYILVYPSAPPVITYDDTVGYTCQGDVVTLYITNYVPGTYYWWVYHVSTGWFNTGSHDTTYSYIPDPANGSFFYVTYTNGAGCSSTSNTILIQPQYTVYFPNNPLTVNGYTLSTPNNGHQAQWYNWGVPIPGANGISYTVTQTGCYSKEAWFAGYPACAVMSDTVCFLFSGMEEQASNPFTIFPNPANDQLHIQLNGYADESAQLQVFDMLGCQVLNVVKNIPSQSADPSLSLDISSLEDGMYVLRIGKTKFSSPIRFVKNGIKNP